MAFIEHRWPSEKFTSWHLKSRNRVWKCTCDESPIEHRENILQEGRAPPSPIWPEKANIVAPYLRPTTAEIPGRARYQHPKYFFLWPLPLICLGKAERRNEKGRPSSSKTLYWRLRLDSLFSKAVVKLRVSSLKHGYDLFMAVEAHEREFEEGVGSHSKTSR